MELDPINSLLQAFLGVVLFNARRYEEAINQLRDALRKTPQLPFAKNVLAGSLYMLGRNEEALQIWTELDARGDQDFQAAVEQAHSRGGFAEGARRQAQLNAERYRRGAARALDVAAMYALAGDSDDAIEWLERAFEDRSPNLPYLGVLPIFDDLRDEPRFQQLLQQMNLPR